jgi:hypothetical protein
MNKVMKIIYNLSSYRPTSLISIIHISVVISSSYESWIIRRFSQIETHPTDLDSLRPDINEYSISAIRAKIWKVCFVCIHWEI